MPTSAAYPACSNRSERSGCGASSATALVIGEDILSRRRGPARAESSSGSGNRPARTRVDRRAGRASRPPRAGWSAVPRVARVPRSPAASDRTARRWARRSCRRCGRVRYRSRCRAPPLRRARESRRASSLGSRARDRAATRAAGSERPSTTRSAVSSPGPAITTKRVRSSARAIASIVSAKRSGGQRRNAIRAPTCTITRRSIGVEAGMTQPRVDGARGQRLGGQLGRIRVGRGTRDAERFQQIPLVLDAVPGPQLARAWHPRGVHPGARGYLVADPVRRARCPGEPRAARAAVEIDGQVEAPPPQIEPKREVVSKPASAHPAPPPRSPRRGADCAGRWARRAVRPDS